MFFFVFAAWHIHTIRMRLCVAVATTQHTMSHLPEWPTGQITKLIQMNFCRFLHSYKQNLFQNAWVSVDLYFVLYCLCLRPKQILFGSHAYGFRCHIFIPISFCHHGEMNISSSLFRRHMSQAICWQMWSQIYWHIFSSMAHEIRRPFSSHHFFQHFSFRKIN